MTFNSARLTRDISKDSFHVPRAGSPTLTLLRLHSSRASPPSARLPKDLLKVLMVSTVVSVDRLPECDGRCVQGPGTGSPGRDDARLLAIPTSRGRVAAPDPNWGASSGFLRVSPSVPIVRPIVAQVQPTP